MIPSKDYVLTLVAGYFLSYKWSTSTHYNSGKCSRKESVHGAITDKQDELHLESRLEYFLLSIPTEIRPGITDYK